MPPNCLKMGNFLSRGLAPSEKGLKRSDQEGLTKSPTETKKRPTERRDGRSYAEVVSAGPETSAMSKLRKSSVGWKFVATPKDKKV